MDASDKIIATTKVSIPQGDGPIEAISTIEAVPNSALYNNEFDKIDAIETIYEKTNNYKDNEYETQTPMVTPYKQLTRQHTEYQPSTAPLLQNLQEIGSNSKLLLNLQGRQHEFTSRTILRNESCFHCLKKYVEVR